MLSVIICEDCLSGYSDKHGGKARAQELKIGLVLPLNFGLTVEGKASYQ